MNVHQDQIQICGTNRTEMIKNLAIINELDRELNSSLSFSPDLPATQLLFSVFKHEGMAKEWKAYVN